MIRSHPWACGHSPFVLRARADRAGAPLLPGIRNSLDPAAKRDIDFKYKPRLSGTHTR